MSALAEALVSLGHTVSGADRLVGSTERAFWPPSLARLIARGVKIFPDDGSGVDSSVKRVVVSTAIEEDNPGLLKAQVPATATSLNGESASASAAAL